MKWFKPLVKKYGWILLIPAVIALGWFLLTKDVIYWDFDVKVTKVSNETVAWSSAERISMTDEIAYGGTDFIVDGVIRKCQSIEAAYTYMEVPCVSDCTILELEIRDIIYNGTGNAYQPGDIVKVLLPFSTHRGIYIPGNEYPILAENKKVLLFCHSSTDIEEDSLKCEKYTDFTCSSPYSLMLEKRYGYYIAERYLANSLGEDVFWNMTDERVTSDSGLGFAKSIIEERYGCEGWEDFHCIGEESAVKAAIAQKARDFSENSL